jgi:GNAT superfamily N-acetyltransferase
MLIRPFAPSDRSVVAALWHDAWHDGHGAIFPTDVVAQRTLATFDLRLAGIAADALVAEGNDSVVGFVSLWQNEVDQLYVAAPARGSGVATALLEAAETELAARGIADAVVQCSVGNARAYRFYRQRGWTDTGIEDLPIWMPEGMHRTHPTHVFTKKLPTQGTLSR